MTAGEHNNRVVDHFPMSRASRWKPNPNGGLDILVDPTEHQYDNVRNASFNTRNQQIDNQINYKRSGTASYVTTSGVKIKVNKDSKHLNGNLKTEKETNMNLMFYDFNNPSVISEESTRNMLRSQTTDRGPSRKLRSKGRKFALVSS